MTTTEQAPGQAGPRILLVEDEPRIRDFITRALVTAGYEVTPAGCGTEGLRLAQASDYDLVILDLIMPDIDGRLVLAQVLRERREQAVLVLSCLADVTTRLEFLLLRELMEHAGQSVGKGQLLASVWGYDFDPGSNVVDVCVRRLRSKLGFDLIKTVRGEGYQLTA